VKGPTKRACDRRSMTNRSVPVGVRGRMRRWSSSSGTGDSFFEAAWWDRRPSPAGTCVPRGWRTAGPPRPPWAGLKAGPYGPQDRVLGRVAASFTVRRRTVVRETVCWGA
jgi:hypothetical protein